MSIADEITRAIGAHAMWKNRLRNAIAEGRSDWTADKIQPDNLCDFGKWLYSLPASDKSSEHWKKVQSLHAGFHQEAARVMELALKGHKDEAKSAMTSGGAFASCSANLTEAMLIWRKGIS